MQQVHRSVQALPDEPRLQFDCSGIRLSVPVHNLIIAGWTGRDSAVVEHHIAELEAIGVPRPRTTPTFYRVGTNLLTTDSRVDVAGTDTSGEVEFVLLYLTEGLFFGVGSDHTDRKVEAYGVTVSKQVCPKPLGKVIWPMREVMEHWDSLILRSWVTCDGARRPYQEGSVNKMLTPSDLTDRYTALYGPLTDGTVMFGGTLPVIGPVSGGELFEIELDDPIRGRQLSHAYSIRSMAFAD